MMLFATSPGTIYPLSFFPQLYWRAFPELFGMFAHHSKELHVDYALASLASSAKNRCCFLTLLLVINVRHKPYLLAQIRTGDF